MSGAGSWNGRERQTHRAHFVIPLYLVRVYLWWFGFDTHCSSNWPITNRDGSKAKAQAVILGLGSMFNHSAQDQNVVWERDVERQIITYRALHNIKAGEELC